MKEKLEIKGNKRYPIVHIRIVWLKRELINDHDEIIWCSREVKIREYACCECLFKINFFLDLNLPRMRLFRGQFICVSLMHLLFTGG